MDTLDRRSSKHSSIFNMAMKPNDDDDDGTKIGCNKITRGTLVVLCLVLIILGLIMIGIGIFSPCWFLLDVIEYSQEWEFGLWMYCRRGGDLHMEVGVRGLDLRQWICDLRDTIPNQEHYRAQSAFVSTDHNEIPVLICLSLTFIFLCISLFVVCCAYCSRYIPYCLVISNFLAMILSLIAIILYLVSMQEVEARRFTSYNSVYMLTFGYALYCTVAGVVILVLNFVFSLPLAVLSFGYYRSKDEYGSYPGSPNKGRAFTAVVPSRPATATTYGGASGQNTLRSNGIIYDEDRQQSGLGSGVYVIEQQRHVSQSKLATIETNFDNKPVYIPSYNPTTPVTIQGYTDMNLNGAGNVSRAESSV